MMTGNYAKLLYAIVDSGVLAKEFVGREGNRATGTVISVHVYHDDWCGIFSGERCNCDPSIMVEEVPEVKES